MAYLPTNNTLTVGGRVFTDFTNLIVLYASFGGATPYSTARLMTGSGGTGYTPSGSNKFRVLAVQAFANGGAAGAVGIGYGNTDIGFASAAASTTPVYPGGGSSAQCLFMASSATVQAEASMNFLVPNGKYLQLLGDGVSYASCIIYGYEEA